MAESSPQLKSDAINGTMKQHLSTDAGKNSPRRLTMLGKGEVSKGPYDGGKPDATFSFKDDDFVKVALGSMNPQMAFLRGATQKFIPDTFPKPSKM